MPQAPLSVSIDAVLHAMRSEQASLLTQTLDHFLDVLNPAPGFGFFASLNTLKFAMAEQSEEWTKVLIAVYEAKAATDRRYSAPYLGVAHHDDFVEMLRGTRSGSLAARLARAMDDEVSRRAKAVAQRFPGSGTPIL